MQNLLKRVAEFSDSYNEQKFYLHVLQSPLFKSGVFAMFAGQTIYIFPNMWRCQQRHRFAQIF